MRFLLISGPDGIHTFLPHQVFGLKWARETARFVGM